MGVGLFILYLNVFPVAHAYILYTSHVIVYVSCLQILWIECFYPPYECCFSCNIIEYFGFVHLPEKVLDIYLEIKGVLNLVVCFEGRGELLSDFLTFQFNN